MSEHHNVLQKDGEVRYYPGCFTPEESDYYLQVLMNDISWKQEPVKMFGNTVMQPRLTAWYGDTGKTYSYSGITMVPLPWSAALLEIKQRVEQLAEVSFNSALLNQYRSQADSMGWHRDNEKELGVNPVIGSVSFGATRTFRLRHYKEKELQESIALTHGSFLLMRGETQHCWLHSIPKTTKAVATRINITFRVIV